MNYDQFMFMLAPILKVKWNDPMTLSKHEVTGKKENKETGNDYTFPVSQMLWNCLEDSRAILPPQQ